MSIAIDLPLRTWHGWWLDRPKWLRIGVWAAGGIIGLHVAIAAWIAIGLVESPEIQSVHRAGGIVLYTWSDPVPQPFPGYYLIREGLRGRSARNVKAVIIPAGDNTLIEHCVKDFPNCRFIVTTELKLQRKHPYDNLFFVWFCESLAQQYEESLPVLIAHDLETGAGTKVELPSKNAPQSSPAKVP